MDAILTQLPPGFISSMLGDLLDKCHLDIYATFENY